MRYLLDTQAFLWLISDDAVASARSRRVFLDEGSELFLSVVSLWEIGVKHSLGKLALRGSLREIISKQLRDNGIAMLPIDPEHVWRVAELPFHHRDPFDRLLAAQALCEAMAVVSGDAALDAYGVDRVW
ncbi:MAG: type II toxin-antitoxin system VapC family toxin [Deltaproteobacteria bacterium]|nr:type II toxin-antitoxin system VapC family toxin [Deltaproteobacteria bacterium]